MTSPFTSFNKEPIKRVVPLIERIGVVSVVSGDRTTYPQFAANVTTVQTTPGSGLTWMTAGGGGVAGARNELVESARHYARGKPFWLWFIDDDHVFPKDVLDRLVRLDRDIIVPMVMARRPPHRWLAWKPFPVHTDMSDGQLIESTRTIGIDPPVVRRGDEIVELGLCGTGGMLIRSEVFEAMPSPWFEFGKIGSDQPGEDTWFCMKARRLGFQIYCDLGTSIGHLTTAAIWPARDDATGQIGSRVDVAVDIVSAVDRRPMV